MFACGLAKCYAIFNTHSNRTLPSSSRLFFFVQTQQDGQKANKKHTSASLKRPAYNCHNHQPLTCTSPKNLDLSWYVSYMYQLMETASYPAQSHFQFLCSKMKVHNAVLNGCLWRGFNSDTAMWQMLLSVLLVLLSMHLTSGQQVK